MKQTFEEGTFVHSLLNLDLGQGQIISFNPKTKLYKVKFIYTEENFWQEKHIFYTENMYDFELIDSEDLWK